MRVCGGEPVTDMHVNVFMSGLCVCGVGFMLCILSLSGWQLTVINISQLTNGKHRQARVCVCVCVCV